MRLGILVLLMIGSSNVLLADDARKGVRWGALPVSQYSTDDGLTLGILARRFDYGEGESPPFKNLLTIQATYSTVGPRGGFVSYEKTDFSSVGLRVEAALSFLKNDQDRFYGIGDSVLIHSDLSEEGYYQYSSLRSFAYFSARKKLESGWEPFASLELGYRLLEPPTETSAFAREFGSGKQVFWQEKLRMGVIRDLRNYEFTPSEGSYLGGYLTFSPAWLNSKSAWARGDLDYRHFWSLVEDRWLVLVGQARYSASTPSTPITDQARLGGESTLRGLRGGRFLSNHSLSTRIELRSVWLRWTVFDLPLKAGTGLFVDGGKIGQNINRLFSTPYYFGYGASFFGSYFTDDFVMRGDLAFSREGFGLYVGLGHVF